MPKRAPPESVVGAKVHFTVARRVSAMIGHPRMASESIRKTALVMSLKDSIKLFYANDANVRSLLQKAHTVAAEAELHVMLLHALRGLTKRAISSSAQS